MTPRSSPTPSTPRCSLARLLRDTIHTGASCRYDPDPARPVTWLLDSPTTEE
ncbi:hypothetical protein [Embleya sp. NPDC020886]|uniref:hypothetical protein n=1 Tax=Embleya sp. NPDC020886 TaxID=3363980 RepID=UPI0037A36667